VPRAYLEACAGRPVGVSFRAIVDSDHQFLRDLYASVRAAELAPVAWPQEAKRQFLDDQFALQHQHYLKNYVGADLLLIERYGMPIGRIYVYRTATEIRLMDIALVAEQRGCGIGSALLHELMDEARATNRQLTLHVEPDNPAQRLYQRLGFSLIEHRGVYDFLGWKAPN
jgi:ribosomal protein S18 acetylase RimI-like enzyme